MDIYSCFCFVDRYPLKLKQFINIWIIVLILNMEFLSNSALMPDCPLYQMHFQKIIGVRPKSVYINERNRIYPDNRNSDLSTISLDCYKICKKDPDCIAYVHILDLNECYGYSLLQRTTHYLGIENKFPLIEDPNAIFYEKICINVPENCNDRLWIITKIPGNSLMLEGKKTIPSLITRRECAEKCLFERNFNCLSASFQPSFRNNHERFNEQLQEQEHKALGRCTLSDKDKMIQPDAYRTAPFEEEYIENQCHIREIESDFCSYELYSDSTFNEACTEAQYIGVSQKKCQSLCTKTTTFHCQGASYYYDGDLTNSHCSLHSEDIISLGPRSLKLKKNSVYLRRVKCLDVQVTCTRDEMTVKYTPKDWFKGKMYTSWHSKDCAIKGFGNESIALHLAIGSEKKEKRCGILRAYEVNESIQRTFITTFVVIQNNPNVQTQGDRLIKVGCILTGPITLMQDDLYDAKENKNDVPNAIALESSLNPTKLFPTNYTYNSTETLPKITLQIIDLSQQHETKDVKIGQNLELQIIAEFTEEMQKNQKSMQLPPPNFHATSLLAKSDRTKDSILLIDERGCPTDVTVFPAFERIKTNTQNMLRAQFHAFKFAGTSTVNFDVNIHFCVEQCPEDNCLQYSKNSNSKTRSRRQRLRRQSVPNQKNFGNPVYFSSFSETEKSQNTELPLTYNLRVYGFEEKNLQEDFYVEEPQFIIFGADANATNFCLNQSLLIALFIFFLILVTMLIFGCCFVIQKSRRFEKFSEEGS